MSASDLHTPTGVPSHATAEQVAPLLPPTAEAPEPARRINFFLGPLLYWVRPKRYGPHLAVKSWKRALLAHLMALVISAVAIGAAVLGDARPSRLSLHELRVMAAEQVVEWAIQSAQRTGSGFNWMEVILTVLGLPILEVGLVLLAIMLMPWCAGGDRAGSVFRRSLKNVYWATTFVALAVVVICAFVIWDFDPLRQLERHSDALAIGFILLVMGVPAVMLIRMLVSGAGRYVGPADGPAFAPREPRCDDCGYLIVGLPLEARCPECGLAVRTSLPGGRRRRTAWQENELKPRGFLELIRLQGRVLIDRQFFKTILVHEGLASARHFWWGTWCLIVLATLAILQAWSLLDPTDRVATRTAPAAIGMIGVTLILQSLMMFAACLWGQMRHGIRDYRSSAVVCYYGSPFIWPVAAVLMLWLVVQILIEPSPFRTWQHVFPFLPYWFGLFEFVNLLLFALLLLAIYFWWRRLTSALAAVRYANV